MITESLNESHHHKGAHGYGSLISYLEPDARGTFHHNLYAHHKTRNPRPGALNDDLPGPVLDFRNNLIYNWGAPAGYNGSHRIRINYVGNYLKSGPSTRDKEYAFKIGGPLTRMFAADNFMEGHPKKNRDNWLMIRPPGDTNREVVRASDAFHVEPVNTDAPEISYQRVLEDAGATLPVRDAVDARIVHEVRTGTGRIINSQTDVGGWPELESAPPPTDTALDGMPDEWEKRHGLNPDDASDNSADTDGDGYTNIEEYINAIAP